MRWNLPAGGMALLLLAAAPTTDPAAFAAEASAEAAARFAAGDLDGALEATGVATVAAERAWGAESVQVSAAWQARARVMEAQGRPLEAIAALGAAHAPCARGQAGASDDWISLYRGTSSALALGADAEGWRERCVGLAEQVLAMTIASAEQADPRVVAIALTAARTFASLGAPDRTGAALSELEGLIEGARWDDAQRGLVRARLASERAILAPAVATCPTLPTTPEAARLALIPDPARAPAHTREAWERGWSVLPAAPPQEGPADRALRLTTRAVVATWTGRADEARAAAAGARQAIAAARREPLSADRVAALIDAELRLALLPDGWTDAELAEADDALRRLNERIAAEPQLAVLRASALSHALQIALGRQDLELALALAARQSAELGDHLPQMAWAYDSTTVSILMAMGRVEEATALAARTLQRCERQKELSVLEAAMATEPLRAPGAVEAARARLLGLVAAGASGTRDLNALALYEIAAGQPDAARGHLDEALARAQASPAASAAERASLLENRALTRELSGDLTGALDDQRAALALREAAAPAAMATGSDEQRRMASAALGWSAERAISLHLRGLPESTEAAAVALEAVLRQKGRALEATAEALASVRRGLSAEDAALVDELLAARGALAKATLAGQDEATLAGLRERAAALDEQLAARAPAWRARTAPVTAAQVAAGLPDRGALVEVARWRPFDPRLVAGLSGWGAPRYAAAVLRADGAARWVDLGPADALDAKVTALREAFGAPDRPDARAAAEALDAALWRPLDPLLEGVAHVILAPDGALSLAPLGATIGPDGRYRLERWLVSTVTSGRELARPPEPAAPRPPVILGDPDFDLGARAASPSQTSRGAAAAGLGHFSRLPGAAREAAELRRLLPRARLYRSDQATEARVKALKGPVILHLATHGYALGSPTQGGGRGVALAGDAPLPVLGPGGEDPWLRAGVALAGANVGERDGEDGLLTALEVMGLDLRGTALVTLSACESGLGATSAGEGVLGLRRALAIAGAEAQVLSLWRVDDDATRALMVRFYAGVAKGVPVAEALRRAQLAMLAEPRTASPYLWAAFVHSGRWEALAL